MNKQTVIIVRGIPGSGKSTFAKRWLSVALAMRPGHTGIIVSADSYFTDSEGNYNFDASKLWLAHKQCQHKFAQALTKGTNLIIVDNTNTTLKEVDIYRTPALLVANNVWVWELQTLVETCLQRQSHNVPEDKIRNMEKHLLASSSPNPLSPIGSIPCTGWCIWKEESILNYYKKLISETDLSLNHWQRENYSQLMTAERWEQLKSEGKDYVHFFGKLRHLTAKPREIDGLKGLVDIYKIPEDSKL